MKVPHGLEIPSPSEWPYAAIRIPFINDNFMLADARQPLTDHIDFTAITLLKKEYLVQVGERWYRWAKWIPERRKALREDIQDAIDYVNTQAFNEVMEVLMSQERVRKFHQALNIPAPDKPVPLEEYRWGLRYGLIKEELDEFRDAAEAGNRVEMLDALCDLLFVVYGGGVEMGIDLEPFFAEVFRTNMLKTNGSVRADGKVLKPQGWVAPDIAGIYRDIYQEEP